ncbi:XdhC family protein [Coraliomargarita parva]|uniref:XdhC family protein n=1 Tax=Coraliomargarita parva TaxID=3014050 RepID=UPI0022B4A47A|nr:XdhC/CoxI family protein [Coraliomargarita parva]
MTDREFWKIALQELEAGRRLYACFVGANKKGSPGTTAARMLLLLSGRQVGTIGGGIMEKRVLEEAKELLASNISLLPQCRRLSHRAQAEEEVSGLICGGEQTNIYMLLEPDVHLDVVRSVLHAIETDSHGFLIINGNSISFNISKERPKKTVELKLNGNIWELYISIYNPRRLAIFGGGHCGVVLARLMHDLGYHVSLIEPREDVFTLEGLPGEVVCLHAGFYEAASLIRYPEDTLAVVMTYSMLTDVEALAGVLSTTFAWSGVMGSKPKLAAIRKALKERGFSVELIESIHAPIGLDMNSDTPMEIAVSIAAQILLERENKNHG